MSSVNSLYGCYYIGVAGQSFALVHLIPLLVTTVLFGFSVRRDQHGRWGKDIFIVMYGFYLHFWQFGLYAFQTYFARSAPDPFCSQIHNYVFPSQEAFYIASMVAGVVSYSFLWNVPVTWFWWTVMWLVTATPAILVFYAYNRWWEVLFSMGLGAVVTVAYVTVFRLYLLDYVPFMINQAPWTWFSCIDSMCLDDGQLKLCDRIPRCIARIEKPTAAARARGPRGSSSPWARSWP